MVEAQLLESLACAQPWPTQPPCVSASILHTLCLLAGCGLAQHAFDAYVSSGEKAITATWGKSLYASTRLEALFPKVKAPTLVLWGADDKLFPSVLCSAFSAQIPGSTCHMIPGAGHFPQIDQPDATIKAIADFLG